MAMKFTLLAGVRGWIPFLSVTPIVTAPAAPVLAAAAGTGQNTLTIVDSSTGGSAITSRKIYRATVDGGAGSLLTTLSSGQSFIDTTVTNGSAYYYTATTVNAIGESPRSNQVSATPTAAGTDTAISSVSRVPKPGTQSNSAPVTDANPTISTLSATTTRPTVIDPTTTYQTYEGMGVQLQHATQFNLNKLPAATKDQVLDNAFGSGKINFVRCYLGSGAFLAFYKEDGAADYSTLTGPLSDLTPQDASLPGFTMERQMAEVGDIVKLALAKNPNIKVFLTCATPPAWMKTGYNTTQLDNTQKLAQGTGGVINPAYYQHYANYLVRGMQEMIARGIPIYSLAVQNEPDNVGTYPTCRWTAAQIVTFTRDFLWPAMGAANLQYVQIWSGEVNLVDATKFVDTINDGSGMADIIKGASYHNYSGPMSNMRYAKYPNIGHHITEYRTLIKEKDGSGNYVPANNQSQVSAVWNNMVIEAFRSGAASSSMFVFALDENGSPSTNNLYRRGVVTILSDNTTVKYNQEFYMLTQVAKYTQPGGKRIDSNQGAGINNVAFLNPDGTTTIHFFNTSNSTTRTTDVIDAVSGKMFTLTLGAYEATSLVMRTASVSGAKTAKINGLAAVGAETQVTLNWSAGSDSTRKAIAILRRTGTGAYATIAVVKATDTSYVDTAVTTGVNYDYMVQGIGNGKGELSSVVNVTTTGTVAPVLGQITMTFSSAPRSGVSTTITIAGNKSGSTVSIATNEGQILDASSGSVAWIPQAVGPDALTPTETLATAANSPFVSDQTAVDVLPPISNLQNLGITFPSQPKVGVPITGTVLNATTGSTITILTQGGTTLNVAADRTFSYTPTTAGDRTLTPTETLAGYANSPYTTTPPITVNVAAASAAPAFLDTMAGTAETLMTARSSDSGHTYVLQPGASSPKTPRVGSGVMFAPDVSSPGAWVQSSFTPTSANYRVDATIKCRTVPAVTSGVTVYARATANTDAGYTVVYNGFTGAWTLQRRDNGSNVSLGSVTSKMAAGTSGTWSLILNGSAITFIVNGATVGTYTDTTYSAPGYISLKSTGGTTSENSGCVIDDVSVTYL